MDRSQNASETQQTANADKRYYIVSLITGHIMSAADIISSHRVWTLRKVLRRVSNIVQAGVVKVS